MFVTSSNSSVNNVLYCCLCGTYTTHILHTTVHHVLCAVLYFFVELRGDVTNAMRWNDQNYRNQESHPEVYAIGLTYIVEVSEGVGMCWNIALLKNRVRSNIQLLQCKSKAHKISLCISGTFDYFSETENVLLEKNIYFCFNTSSDILLINYLSLSISCTSMSA